MNYITEPLDFKINRNSFSCGKPMLDNYFWYQAKQDVSKKLSACFVLLDKETNNIKGYYTLSGNSISNHSVPEYFSKRFPKSYLSIPTILLGRLAIDKKDQGKGLGKILLIDALKRCYDTSTIIGAFAVIVDPLDREAEGFYTKYGFIRLPDSRKMFLPINTIMHLFEKCHGRRFFKSTRRIANPTSISYYCSHYFLPPNLFPAVHRYARKNC